MEGPSRDQVLVISTERVGTGAVIGLDGELDLHESERVSAAIADVLADPISILEVEADGLTFIDSAGVRVMLLARAEAERRGITFRFSGVSPEVRRVMEIAGVGDLLPKGG